MGKKKKRINVDDEHARAEIDIERALARFEKITGKKVTYVRVELNNENPNVEIFA